VIKKGRRQQRTEVRNNKNSEQKPTKRTKSWIPSGSDWVCCQATGRAGLSLKNSSFPSFASVKQFLFLLKRLLGYHCPMDRQFQHKWTLSGIVAVLVLSYLIATFSRPSESPPAFPQLPASEPRFLDVPEPQIHSPSQWIGEHKVLPHPGYSLGLIDTRYRMPPFPNEP
jgi:hypothetical protein